MTHNVYAKTAHGKVKHGVIEENKFIRFINHKDVRWSDRSFSINMSILPELERYRVGTLQFYYRTKKYDKIYSYPIPKALEIGKVVQLNGEKNLRLEIDDKYLVSVKPNHNYIPPEPVKENPQTVLF